MIARSQRHKAEVHSYISSPLITGILPDTATIAASGAVGRTVATLSVTGGTAPITYSITAAGGLSAVIAGNLLQTSVNPCGTAGAKTVGIMATDSKSKTLTENIVVTLT
jgi:3-keto-L-gulonate-6-phosphate decarboxylase